MILVASVALGLALLLCAFAWFANRRLIALTLPLAVAIAAAALWVPTGSPRFTRPPPGEYVILGVHIEVDKAIYLLLSRDGQEPIYYVLPYSNGKASELQEAMNAGEGKGVRVKIDGEGGGESYEGPPPVTADETKIPEAPVFQ